MTGKTKNLSIKESLSTRLLLSTIFFVLIIEIVIYVPSAINFRETWLNQKLAEANIAIRVVEAAPDYMVSRMLSDELLTSTENYSIMRTIDGGIPRALAVIEPYEVSARFDMRDVPWFISAADTFKTLLNMQRKGYLIEVTGPATDGSNEEIVIVFDQELLCHDIFIYSRNIVLLTIVISLFTAALVYHRLSNLFVRPVQKITDNMISFRQAPEDLTQRFIPEDREDEIGVVMRELAVMQDEIRKALNQKNHLAKLGSAISNINHDLRNMLASVQLVSDHLATIDNPVVQKLAPRFVKSLDRAIRLCENTLQYGGSEIETPHLLPFNLRTMISDVATSLGLIEDSRVKLINEIDSSFELNADNDQIFRVVMNICRNSLQAIEENGNITVTSKQDSDHVIIDINDDGPGIPVKIIENLFQPFKTGNKEGTGLGLAISREMVRAHGGTLDLHKSDENGTAFRIKLPI